MKKMSLKKKTHLVAIFLKGKKKTNVMYNNLSDLTSVSSKISQHIIEQRIWRFVQICRGWG